MFYIWCDLHWDLGKLGNIQSLNELKSRPHFFGREWDQSQKHILETFLIELTHWETPL